MKEQDLALNEQDRQSKKQAFLPITLSMNIPSEARRKELIGAAKAAVSVGNIWVFAHRTRL